jgi:hypothetical protein
MSGDVWYAAIHRQHTGTRLGAPLYHGKPESAEGLAAVNGRVLGPVVHDSTPRFRAKSLSLLNWIVFCRFA